MKGSDNFKNTIQNYLLQKALIDPIFAEIYKKETKNLDDCITYILNTVQKSGINGYDDDEIYNMAMHYYIEDVIEVGKESCATVVVNHHIDLTQEEIDTAKESAIKAVEKEQIDKLKKKHVAPKAIVDSKQQSLF